MFELEAAELRHWDDGRNSNDRVGLAGGWCVDPREFQLFIATDGYGSSVKRAGLRGVLTVVDNGMP